MFDENAEDNAELSGLAVMCPHHHKKWSLQSGFNIEEPTKKKDAQGVEVENAKLPLYQYKLLPPAVVADSEGTGGTVVGDVFWVALEKAVQKKKRKLKYVSTDDGVAKDPNMI